MGIIFYDIAVEILLGATLVFWLFYTFMTSDYSYWKNRSIAYVEPSFPFGSDKDMLLMKQQIGRFYQSVYVKFGKEKVVGMFALGKPYLLIRDPELLKQIMAKDFHHFVDRGLFDPDVMHPAMRHLFHMRGESWKQMRHKLTSAFTSGKMKMMFYLMEACSNELTKGLEPIAEKNGKIVVKEFIACFTTDVIASCAFGLQSNSIKNPNNEFRENGKKLLEMPRISNVLKQRLVMNFPWMIKARLIKPFSADSKDFFMNIVADTIAYRERSGVVRNDFIDILVKLKNNANLFEEEENDTTKKQNGAANGEAGITLEEMTAQAILFFLAGFETASSAMTFCLYEICVNPEIQSKMRQEIDVVLAKHNGKLSYDALQDMSYMEAVINETLRHYSSLSILNRDCTDDYRLPDSDLVIPKGMKIVMPVYAIHHDPAYYPDPDRFDPERFREDKIKTKNNYTFIPFGEGPRMCLGTRFAYMQMKSCLSTLLHKYELTVTEDTPIPVRISKKFTITVPESPIILKISKRRD